MKKLSFIFLLILNIPLNCYAIGSFAIDGDTLKSGMSWDAITKEEADANAIKYCASKGCKTLANFQGTCGSLSISYEGKLAYGAGQGPTKEIAQNYALGECRKYGDHCKIAISGCDSNQKVTAPQPQANAVENVYVASSFKQACFNSEGNYKSFNYSDGAEANVVTDIFDRDRSCACNISASNQRSIEINPSLRDQQSDPLAIRKPFPLNLWNIYTIAKYPYGGCPSDADYRKIVQEIINDNRVEAKRAEENKPKPFTKQEIAASKKICTVIVSKVNAAKNYCANAPSPSSCMKIKRNLIESETVSFPTIIGVLEICSELGYPLSIFDWER